MLWKEEIQVSTLWASKYEHDRNKMNLKQLYEQISEVSLARKFSDFMSAVNGLSDLLMQDNPPEDFVKSLGEYSRTMKYWQSEIGSMHLTDDEWQARKTPQMPDRWNTARDLICRGKLQRILDSIADIIKEPVSKDNVKVRILKEKVDDLRDIMTGIAAVPMASPIPPA